MNALEALNSRRSFSKLLSPAPNADELKIMLSAAMSAPDHKELRPWHFVVMQGDARQALGNAAADGLTVRNPDATEGQIEKERNKPLRAPVVIAVAARFVESRLAFSELVASACAATQNLLIAAHALGYGAIWRSGEFMYDELVKTHLGLQTRDELVGLVYIGTPEGDAPERASTDQAVVDWRE